MKNPDNIHPIYGTFVTVRSPPPVVDSICAINAILPQDVRNSDVFLASGFFTGRSSREKSTKNNISLFTVVHTAASTEANRMFAPQVEFSAWFWRKIHKK